VHDRGHRGRVQHHHIHSLQPSASQNGTAWHNSSLMTTLSPAKGSSNPATSCQYHAAADLTSRKAVYSQMVQGHAFAGTQKRPA
jgi:hypothetical protein